MSDKAWPFPGDSALDRARRIAQSYRNALQASDPTTCGMLDDAALGYGEEWIRPALSRVELDDLVTIEEAAALVGRSTDCIHKWVQRDKLRCIKSSDRKLRVRVGDVLDISAEYRRRRAKLRVLA